MEKNTSKEKDINNFISNKKLEQEKSIESIKNYLSDKKEKNSLSFIKNTLNNNENDIKNDITNRKIIKVNKDNRSKSKKNITSPKNINSIKKPNIKIDDIKIEEYENISIAQKINKFESRIDNLLNVINDFETKFIKSPETQRIKDQFNIIMNKKIYNNRTTTDPLYKSWIKTKCNSNNNIFLNNDNKSVLKDSFVMDIKNINISINNNRYENNYFITHSNQNKFIHHNPFNKKQNSSEKNFNLKINNNSIFKKSILKSSKKKPKCISNDTKNKIIQNYKDKTKLFNLPLDFIINNNTIKNNIKNYRYNNSYKEFSKPLTDRKEKETNDKIINKSKLKNKLKSENKKRNNCLRINKIVCNKDEKGKKPFIKKEELKKDNLLKTKKKLFSKNSAPSTLQVNNLVNFSINRGKSNKEKGKNNINYSNLNKNKENTNNCINYSLNKRKIIKRNNVITTFNNH